MDDEVSADEEDSVPKRKRPPKVPKHFVPVLEMKFFLLVGLGGCIGSILRAGVGQLLIGLVTRLFW